jgi:hypothetical protein
VKSLIDYIKNKSGKDENSVKKVLSVLLQTGKLKSKVEIEEKAASNESRTRNFAVLSLKDVTRAQELYLESGGSSRRWVQLLVEGGESERKWINKIKSGEFSTADELKKAFEEKAGRAAGYSKVGPEVQNRLLTQFDSLKGGEVKTSSDEKKTEPEKAAAESKKDDDSELRPDLFLKKMREKGMKPGTDAGQTDALRMLKSEYGVEGASALSFYRNKVLPLVSKETTTTFDDTKKDDSKHAKIAKELAKTLEDVEPATIVAILDAIPEYLMAA